MVINQFNVLLPKKHNKGGQSSNRFAHIREEKRLIYTKKVAENINKVYIVKDQLNVKGLFICGYADFKNLVFECPVLDYRIKAILIKTVDVAYGGQNGFNQAINLC